MPINVSITQETEQKENITIDTSDENLYKQSDTILPEDITFMRSNVSITMPDLPTLDK